MIEVVYKLIHFTPLGNCFILDEFDTEEAAELRKEELQKRAPEAVLTVARVPRSPEPSPNVGDFLIGRDGALLCACGDPRSDHPNDGPCNLNGLGHGIPSTEPESKCWAYRANKEPQNDSDKSA